MAPTTGQEPEAQLVELVQGLARRLPAPAVVLPTDDESAVLLAEHREELAPELIVPAVEPSLPRRLANKRGLYETCVANGFPTPRTAFPESRDDVEAFAGVAQFPVVVKNVAPFDRLTMPAVPSTTVVTGFDELLTMAKEWTEPPPVLLQEFIPDEESEDWFFHGYFNAASECLVGFTAVKYRAWPPHRGVSTYSRYVVNDELDGAVRDLARKIGFHGIVDLDIRLDRRDGRYKLLDFNPRVGAQFRVFETDAGIDVVRALHLDLTGREVPAGRPVNGRGMIVEHLDVPAMLAYRQVRPGPDSTPHSRGRTEFAWWAADDPVPFFVMAARSPSLLRNRLATRRRPSAH